FPRYDRKPFEFHHVAPMSMMRLLARLMGKNITEGHQALRNYVRDRRFLSLWGKACCAPKDGPQVHVSQPSALLRAPRPLVPYAEHAPARCPRLPPAEPGGSIAQNPESYPCAIAAGTSDTARTSLPSFPRSRNQTAQRIPWEKHSQDRQPSRRLRLQWPQRSNRRRRRAA